MAAEGVLAIEVVYARAEAQEVVALKVPAGTSAAEALRRSGLPSRYPELQLETPRLGIYGRVVSPDTALADGDRVEIYRPLVADAKQARRRRADKDLRRSSATLRAQKRA